MCIDIHTWHTPYKTIMHIHESSAENMLFYVVISAKPKNLWWWKSRPLSWHKCLSQVMHLNLDSLHTFSCTPGLHSAQCPFGLSPWAARFTDPGPFHCTNCYCGGLRPGTGPSWHCTELLTRPSVTCVLNSRWLTGVCFLLGRLFAMANHCE